MAEFNNTSISSGENKDMLGSVSSAKNNKLLLDNISKIYNFENIIELPMSFLRKYENILKSNLMEYKLPRKWHYRPEYLSFYLFGTTDLWYLILFINDMTKPIEFCKDTVYVPNTFYVMEILNKLKYLERDVEKSHEEAIKIERHLLKDINFASDKIEDSDNSFIPNNSSDYEDATSILEDKEFEGISYIPSINFGYFENNKIIASNNVSFPLYFKDIKNKISPIAIPSHNELIKNKDLTFSNHTYEKYFDISQDYVLLNRFNGFGLFTIVDEKNINDKKLNKLISAKEVTFKNLLLSYDMRKASFSPEYLKTNLVVKLNDKIYEPEIDTKEDLYVIKLEKEVCPINFDGIEYFITTKKGERIVLVNNNEENVYHSNNEWIFYKDVADVTLDSDLYFEEIFNKQFGNYVYTILNDENRNNPNVIKLKIDFKRDLESNKINLNKYKFLGFNFFYKIGETTNLINKFPYSPLKIEIVTNELDEDGNNIIYTYTLPTLSKNNFLNEIKIDNEIIYNDCLHEFYNTNKVVSNIKRIIPIIHSCKTREVIDIKEIYVSLAIDNSEENNALSSYSVGGLEIYGFTYDDIASEFAFPRNINNGIYNIDYEYNYENLNKSLYFEPFIFNLNDDLMKSTEDNDKVVDITRLSSYKVETFTTFIRKQSTNSYKIELYNGKKNDICYNDYTLKDFCFEDNYRLTLKLTLTLNNNITNYTDSSISILFDKKDVNTAYIANISQENIFKKNNDEFINKIDDILNSYSFTINTRENGKENTKVSKDVLKNEIIRSNKYFLMPDGLYKMIYSGNTKYQIFKYIEDLNLIVYPIKQCKDISESLYEYLQQQIYENKESFNNTTQEVFIRIIKSNDNICLQYKLNEEDSFCDIHVFNEFTNILKNGTFGFKTYNLNKSTKLEIISYEVNFK